MEILSNHVLGIENHEIRFYREIIMNDIETNN
jgi:hypothetical protein